VVETGRTIIVEDVEFRSEGNLLKGRSYRPQAEGRYPSVAICHGYPGDTKHMDVAEEMALNGIAVLIFYYQGAWGSEGVFRFSNLHPSTRDALDYLRSQPYVNPSRTGIISYSMGAIPAVQQLKHDESLKTGILISPVSDTNIWLTAVDIDYLMMSFVSQASGKLNTGDPEEYKRDLMDVIKEINPIANISDVSVPLLIMAGSRDTIVPPEMAHLLYEAANEPRKWVQVEGADHGYSDHRTQLYEAVLDWLIKYL